MNDQKKEYTGVWLPKEVLDNKELSSFQKILYAEISSFNQCFMLNKTLGEKFGVSETSISKNISKLVDMGLIEIQGFDGRKRYMRALHISAMEHITNHKGSLEDNDKAGYNQSSTIDNKLDNTIENNLHIADSENLHEIDNLFEIETYKKKPERKRDLLFEAVAYVCSIDTSLLTKSGRGEINSAVKQLRDRGASPNDVIAKAQILAAKFPVAITPSSLAKHWAGLNVQSIENIITDKQRNNKLSELSKQYELDETFRMIEQNQQAKLEGEK